ncbi:hypothetical protein SmJEL517_g01053 [Synchytrium microbalum]|uniref:Calponin-homology (CH) domain-containing protein n=1 Tax=Synchytrium microbalum TaxID=1806994 RepID=A0A507CC08_9FUNG|nr:uncharacterized protein SmJEL517_g01053 [Synchytrium microbalum]TPX37152.1 hypothetical protein SmJEL517_g01053 [Synchytrium microbalum]
MDQSDIISAREAEIASLKTRVHELEDALKQIDPSHPLLKESINVESVRAETEALKNQVNELTKSNEHLRKSVDDLQAAAANPSLEALPSSGRQLTHITKARPNPRKQRSSDMLSPKDENLEKVSESEKAVEAAPVDPEAEFRKKISNMGGVNPLMGMNPAAMLSGLKKTGGSGNNLPNSLPTKPEKAPSGSSLGIDVAKEPVKEKEPIRESMHIKQQSQIAKEPVKESVKETSSHVKESSTSRDSRTASPMASPRPASTPTSLADVKETKPVGKVESRPTSMVGTTAGSVKALAGVAAAAVEKAASTTPSSNSVQGRLSTSRTSTPPINVNQASPTLTAAPVLPSPTAGAAAPPKPSRAGVSPTKGASGSPLNSKPSTPAAETCAPPQAFTSPKIAGPEGEIRSWIAEKTGDSGINDGSKDLQVLLKDGVLLCHLVNALGVSNPIKVNTGKFQFNHVENINNYLMRAETGFGLNRTLKFEASDLTENSNMGKVLAHIQALKAKIAEKK